MSIRPWCLAALLSLTAAAASAQEPTVAAAPTPADGEVPQDFEPTPEQIAAMIAEFEATLNYQKGQVEVADGKALLKLPPTFRFLSAVDAQRLLEGPWGNPPDEEVLGMLVPADVSPLDAERGWAVIVKYEEAGHVDDADAASIDYDEMMRSMQAAQRQDNELRRAQGFQPVELRGWAEPPRYDAAEHKLYWAMRANFGGEGSDTLNYAIRVLGRVGVLDLNVVASAEQLAEVKAGMGQVVTFVSFTPGNRYADFDASTDRLATFGVGGLISGGQTRGSGGALTEWLVLGGLGLVAIGLILRRMLAREKA